MPVGVHLDEGDIARLQHQIIRLSRRIRKHSGAELTPSKLSALATLERHGPMRLGALTDHEQIGKSSGTRLVAALESLGHVQLSRDAADGRSSQVALTEQGHECLAASRERAHAYLARQAAALGPDDQRRLLAALPALDRLLDVKA